MPIKHSWAKPFATITGVMHWKSSCSSFLSHWPDVATAWSLSQENNFSLDFRTTLIMHFLSSSNSRSISSYTSRLITVTGDPVSKIALMSQPLIFTFNAISGVLMSTNGARCVNFSIRPSWEISAFTSIVMLFAFASVPDSSELSSDDPEISSVFSSNYFAARTFCFAPVTYFRWLEYLFSVFLPHLSSTSTDHLVCFRR